MEYCTSTYVVPINLSASVAGEKQESSWFDERSTNRLLTILLNSLPNFDSLPASPPLLLSAGPSQRQSIWQLGSEGFLRHGPLVQVNVIDERKYLSNSRALGGVIDRLKELLPRIVHMKETGIDRWVHLDSRYKFEHFREVAEKSRIGGNVQERRSAWSVDAATCCKDRRLEVCM